jgi:hypothetical protein
MKMLGLFSLLGIVIIDLTVPETEFQMHTLLSTPPVAAKISK